MLVLCKYFLKKRGDNIPSKKPVLMTYTEKETIEKFKIVAKNDSRTMSKELEYIVKEKIKEYEKENGEIKLIDK